MSPKVRALSGQEPMQTPQETQYLQTLAQKLRLEAPLVAEIHQQIQAAAARPAR